MTAKEMFEKLGFKKIGDDANETIILLQASEPILELKKSIEKTQQKEFINYLEDEIAKCIHQKDIFYVGMKRAFDLSLQKYKKITQPKNDKFV